MTQETVKKRNITAIALSVICIVLAASLVVTIAFQPNKGTDQQATIDNLEQQIAALQLQLNQTVNPASYLAQIASLQSQLSYYQDLNASLAEVSTTITNYEQLLALQKSSIIYVRQTLTQNPNSVTTIYTGSTIYAGYVVVQVAASNANSTYAQVLYTFGETNFNYNQTIGTTGTAIFPVLPSLTDNSFIVSVGNTQTDITNATTTVTATFYY